MLDFLNMRVNLVNLKIILLQLFAVFMAWYTTSQIIEVHGHRILSYVSGLFYSLFFIFVLFLCFLNAIKTAPNIYIYIY